MEDVYIEPASQNDLDKIKEMVTAVGLPVEGIDESVKHFFVARKEQVMGCVGLEVYDDSGLLRSVAVLKEFQGQKLGLSLVHRALAYAREIGLKELYLITETAEEFFYPLGFLPVDRADIPESVKESVEFTTCCGKEAATLKKALA